MSKYMPFTIGFHSHDQWLRPLINTKQIVGETMEFNS